MSASNKISKPLRTVENFSSGWSYQLTKLSARDSVSWRNYSRRQSQLTKLQPESSADDTSSGARVSWRNSSQSADKISGSAVELCSWSYSQLLISSAGARVSFWNHQLELESAVDIISWSRIQLLCSSAGTRVSCWFHQLEPESTVDIISWSQSQLFVIFSWSQSQLPKSSAGARAESAVEIISRNSLLTFLSLYPFLFFYCLLFQILNLYTLLHFPLLPFCFLP
jgi:hypothetical protein